MRYWDVLLEELLADRRLKLLDIAVYLHTHAKEPESLRALERAIGCSRRALTRACGRLADAGWLLLEAGGSRGDRLRPVVLVPADCQLKQVRYLQEEYDSAANKGELLMKRQLDLRVSDKHFVDNARPSAFEHPGTGRRLELDRLYISAAVGFEFCGFYHHPPGEGLTSEEAEEHRNTETRDLIKAGLAKRAGIKLVSITGQELRFETFAAMIPAELKQRTVNPSELYCRELAKVSDAYAAYAERAGREAAKQVGQPTGAFPGAAGGSRSSSRNSAAR